MGKTEHLFTIVTSVALTSLLTMAVWTLFGLQRESVNNWRAYQSCSDTLEYVEGHVLTTRQRWKLTSHLAKQTEEAVRVSKQASISE